MIPTPDLIEGSIVAAVRWIKLGVEIFGAGLVTLGVRVAIVQLIRTGLNFFLSIEMNAAGVSVAQPRSDAVL